ncbi:hypothetical protein [Chitinophaga pinensis]|uniref:DUF1565 domain-containing protein n=1 Tax=Chitinophaga pinensis TaxID=79329 RepID=A0A5C6LJD4_9BACT|nr:hypothetical protein [Chitinophaga pinensis]TWV88736.1 hypothetical protein FEF09_30330 [Chitinophaga pinensis]
MSSYCQRVLYQSNTGNDQHTGTTKTQAWKTFKRLKTLDAGTTVEILEAGAFDQSMLIRASGTEQSPVKIRFAPGNYHFYSDHVEKRQLHITNTNDRPYEQKSIALFFDSCRYVQVEGTGAKVILHGKMIETFVNHCDHINISGLSFDYNRPTVSEWQITGVGEGYADALIHPTQSIASATALLHGSEMAGNISRMVIGRY